MQTANSPAKAVNGARGIPAAYGAGAARILEIPMPKEPINGREPEFSEEDIQREQLGPRGVPGKPDPAKMTPQREKKQPKNVDPGHTA
jgi:hypothetical protein